jgi:hypothetical protein
MNERIKELAKQAEVYSSMWTGNESQEALLEKLAELIVKECAKIADDNFNKGFCPVGDYIKQHFGVE